MDKGIGTEGLAYTGHSRMLLGHSLRQSGTENGELTHVGPGTRCGEYLRRFWLPVSLSSQLKDLPHAIRILGEDLVAFRDLLGNVGVLHRQCSHRRTSLEYGVVAEHGIRCCYHGWLFDVDGTILETPGEPEGSPIKHTLCHGAYPALEYKGIVFAYMGPPELKPEFPIFDTFELPGNEMIPYFNDMPCNWLQVNDNPMDPFHSVFLHTRVTTAHFNPSWGAMPIVEWHRMPDKTGIYLTSARRWNDYVWVRTNELIAPNFTQPPDIFQNPDRDKFFTRVGSSKWHIPVDDTNTRIFGWRHFNDTVDLGGKGRRETVGPGSLDVIGRDKRPYEEQQRVPGDYEAQVGQDTIAVHKLEHLGQTDTGVSILRQLLRRAIRDVKKGKEPPRQSKNADGYIPTMAGDVIINVPRTNRDDDEVRRDLGHKIGAIVLDSMSLVHGERQVEIETRVKSEILA
jgi:nitrite reductase/ring-hydroxylating ferredoxin subunit